MDLSFLDDINMTELENKDEIIKSIRFSKEEFYMLKYCKYLNKRFATFVKELIDSDITNTRIKECNEIDIENLKRELKEELREEIKAELLEEIKETFSKYKIEENSLDKINKDRQELLDFMNNRYE